MTVPRIDVDRLSVANVFFFFDDKNGKEKISISSRGAEYYYY